MKKMLKENKNWRYCFVYLSLKMNNPDKVYIYLHTSARLHAYRCKKKNSFSAEKFTENYEQNSWKLNLLATGSKSIL